MIKFKCANGYTYLSLVKKLIANWRKTEKGAAAIGCAGSVKPTRARRHPPKPRQKQPVRPMPKKTPSEKIAVRRE